MMSMTLLSLLSLITADFAVITQDAGGGAYEAFPDIARMNDGALICLFYDSYDHVGMPNETHPRGGRVSAIISRDEGQTWSTPFVVVDSPADDRDPSLFVHPDGRLICSFFALEADPGKSPPWKGKGSWIVTSRDNGKTWSDPTLVADDAYCSSPIRMLSTGRLLLPLYRESQGSAEGCVSYSDDQGKTWSPVVTIPNGGRRLDAETDLFERAGGELYAIQRAERDSMAWSVSRDRGASWSPSESVGFPGHCPYLHRAPDGSLLLATRLPKTELRRSTDEGRTWGPHVHVDDVIGAYPSMVTLRDDSILIVYYEEGAGSNIRARRFRVNGNEIEWLSMSDR